MPVRQRLVDIENLSVSFPAAGRRSAPVRAVQDVSLHVSSGECLALVGESGSGKSVTARAVIGLAGRRADVRMSRFHIDGVDASSFGEKQFRQVRGTTVGLVLQDALVSLDPLRTIGREVAEPMAIHNTVPRHARSRAAVDLLRSVGIDDPEVRATQISHELSGGLRQRALIASGLAAGPSLLIADEPTTALDVTVQARILALLGDLRDDGTGLLLISHDLAVVAALADRIAVMKDGRIVEQGAAQDILRDPQHEYTRALLSAAPSGATRGTTLVGRTPIAVPSAHSGDPVLVVDAVSKSFDRRDGSRHRAVDSVSLTLRQGEIHGLVGESGSGKSTLASIALGLVEPDTGTVRLTPPGGPSLNWNSPSGPGERGRRAHRSRIQPIWQDPLSSFDPRFTVANVIDRALVETGTLDADARKARTIELLHQVGLDPDHLARTPRRLSGGQRQRVAIARALATEPDILICDEPVSALDVSIQAQVLDLLLDLRARTGVSMIFISHDLGVISHVSDTVSVMKDGAIVERGRAEQIFEDPQHSYTVELLDSVPSLPYPVAVEG
ncbi:dipeptide ABC transporter ATP-binding protein [Rhodococcus sp. 114MFTsu3.1]|uniref:dipeptide ABC transporter ATP-binding protein n=1 Tax=Rhodococcus sp. 114MFTsu3.1 TaxID=1172184 RepID=UPI00039EE376|nr:MULTISPECIES: ABC transporter ATP-binding protein [unclassified Rhodococcus (in: high G+C Gram-positive bacteria)]